MIARLKPGATIAEAQAQIDAHNAAVEEDNPEAKMMAEAGFRSPVVSLHAEHVRSIRPTLLLLQAGVFFLLLIGAVNLVNLLLIRASGRAKEMAIRQSMGASRGHVVSQVMTETVSLTFVGGVLGVIVGAWGTHSSKFSGRVVCRSARTSRLMAGSRRSGSSVRSFSESRSRRRSPGSICAAIWRMRCNPNRARAQPVALRRVCVTVSSSRRSRSRSFFWLALPCSG